jgi:phosphohistidine phosphatase
MDLILWRHAEAEEGSPDAARKLTPKGERQAQKMAKWLKTHLAEPVRILVSSATRAQQTAQALSEKLETREELATGSSARRILRATGWPEGEGIVIVVGHQPTLGQLAALLLSGTEADWNMKKGAIWWFEAQTQDGNSEAVLRAVLAPREI